MIHKISPIPQNSSNFMKIQPGNGTNNLPTFGPSCYFLISVETIAFFLRDCGLFAHLMIIRRICRIHPGTLYRSSSVFPRLLTVSTPLKMADADQLRAQIVEQGEFIKKLKADGSKDQMESALEKLRNLKDELRKLVESTKGSALQEKKHNEELRAGIEGILVQRFFVVPSFEIYRGVSGLFDLGPPGCALRDNILALWRQHFVLEENMLEVSTAALTPEPVLKTSGHVDKFTDLMVRDLKTGESFRADKLLEEHIDKVLEDINVVEAERKQLLIHRSKADAYSISELHGVLQDLKVLSPAGNPLSEPFPFNLMFETQIGPSGKFKGYLRPETAQGIFTNFKRLLEYNGAKLPFAAAQVGPAFRNEISPRSGLLRVREFILAEIEHFVHKDHKEHARFETVKDVELALLPKGRQGDGEDTFILMTAGEAVKSGVINNETLAYFMVRTQAFLHKIGISKNLLRFRQHKDNEMAHYASDCWDAEIRSTYGWVECVGHADRSCYDLEQHAKVSKVDLSAQIVYDEPVIEDTLKVKINKGKLGPSFKKDASKVVQYLESLPMKEAMEFQGELDSNGSASFKLCTGEEFTVTKDHVQFSVVTEKKFQEKFTPAVIEPSFGIGRIMYSLLEHAYYVRDDDEQRRVLSFRPCIAPIKCSVLPLSNNPELKKFVSEICSSLVRKNISVNPDSSSAAIGKRYARADELGIPFGITIDFDTLKKRSVTIRERDTLNQIRVNIDEVPDILSKLVSEEMTWETAYDTYEKFFAQENTNI